MTLNRLYVIILFYSSHMETRIKLSALLVLRDATQIRSSVGKIFRPVYGIGTKPVSLRPLIASDLQRHFWSTKPLTTGDSNVDHMSSINCMDYLSPLSVDTWKGGRQLVYRPLILIKLKMFYQFRRVHRWKIFLHCRHILL